MYKYRFSVFTATFNRGSYLKSVYNDLLNQTYKNFEWIIVSDGSDDDTDTIVASILKQHLLCVNYIKKTNGGKHTAWRTATPLFQGQYVICLDDDDIYPSTMLEFFDQEWKVLESSQMFSSFWEIRARCADEKGNLIGAELPSPLDISWNDLVYKAKKACEMISCRKVEVLREEASVPEYFPYSDKVSNFSEIIRWSRAARKFKSRIIDSVMRKYRYEICQESLSSSKIQSSRLCYNGLVAGIYILNEQTDLMISGRAWRQYFHVLFGLVKNSVSIDENPSRFLNGRLTRILFYLFFYGYKLIKSHSNDNKH